MTEPTAEMDALVLERMRRHHAVVEEACEAALQGGRWGVKVEWNADTTTAWVDPAVPYGQVWAHVLPPAVKHAHSLTDCWCGEPHNQEDFL